MASKCRRRHQPQPRNHVPARQHPYKRHDKLSQALRSSVQLFLDQSQANSVVPCMCIFLRQFEDVMVGEFWWGSTPSTPAFANHHLQIRGTDTAARGDDSDGKDVVISGSLSECLSVPVRLQ